MRDRIYELKYYADFNVRYWSEIEGRLLRLNNWIRILLALGSLVGVAALLAKKEYLPTAAVISAACGLVATAVLPAIGWDNELRNVATIKERWADLEKIIQGLWTDTESGKNLTKKSLDSVEETLASLSKEKLFLRENVKVKAKVEKFMEPYYS